MENSLDFITTYFTEEKIESLFFIIIGFITTLLACFFLWIIKYSFFKGIAFPFLLIGLIQIIVGSTIYQRTPKDILRVEQIIKVNPQHLQNTEIPRIEKVLQHFILYQWIEIWLLILSSCLIIIFYKSPQTFWKGIGLGLLIQAFSMFFLDMIAQHRAEIYLQFLCKF